MNSPRLNRCARADAKYAAKIHQKKVRRVVIRSAWVFKSRYSIGA